MEGWIKKLASDTMNLKTPAEAAYDEWSKYFHSNCPFHKLSKREQSFWTSVADAVISQSKTIIAEEMAKAMTKAITDRIKSASTPQT